MARISKSTRIANLERFIRENEKALAEHKDMPPRVRRNILKAVKETREKLAKIIDAPLLPR